MHLQPAVVLDETQLAELIHKKADAAASGADHFGESSLRDASDDVLGLFTVAITRNQEEGSGQALLARVEELVDQVFFHPDISFEHVGDKAVGKVALFVNYASHFRFFDSQDGNRSESDGGGDTQRLSGDAAFSEEISGPQDGDHGFFSGGGTYNKLDGAGLKVENGVTDIALQKDGLFGTKIQNLLSYTSSRKIVARVKR